MPLTERRKADRVKMSQLLADAAGAAGATVTVDPEGSSTMSPRAVRIGIACPGGLEAGIDFDDQSCQPDVHVVPWHITTRYDNCLADRFPGSVNPYHFAKSTTVRHGFDALLAHVLDVIALCVSGEAYDAARTAASIAKNGTAAEREARWASYRAEADRIKTLTS